MKTTATLLLMFTATIPSDAAMFSIDGSVTAYANHGVGATPDQHTAAEPLAFTSANSTIEFNGITYSSMAYAGFVSAANETSFGTSGSLLAIAGDFSPYGSDTLARGDASQTIGFALSSPTTFVLSGVVGVPHEINQGSVIMRLFGPGGLIYDYGTDFSNPSSPSAILPLQPGAYFFTVHSFVTDSSSYDSLESALVTWDYTINVPEPNVAVFLLFGLSLLYCNRGLTKRCSERLRVSR